MLVEESEILMKWIIRTGMVISVNTVYIKLCTRPRSLRIESAVTDTKMETAFFVCRSISVMRSCYSVES